MSPPVSAQSALLVDWPWRISTKRMAGSLASGPDMPWSARIQQTSVAGLRHPRPDRLERSQGSAWLTRGRDVIGAIWSDLSDRGRPVRGEDEQRVDSPHIQ